MRYWTVVLSVSVEARGRNPYSSALGFSAAFRRIFPSLTPSEKSKAGRSVSATRNNMSHTLYSVCPLPRPGARCGQHSTSGSKARYVPAGPSFLILVSRSAKYIAPPISKAQHIQEAKISG